MKRISMFFVLFLTALCCTLTVSAADYAIHSVTIRGNAVQVNVTAQSDCALWGAVYEESGKMTAANSANVSGAADAQTVTLSFDNIPADAYAKAVLLEKDTFRPLCVPGDNSPVYTDDVYAILYADGTMVFQYGNTPESGREVKEIYVVNMSGTYYDCYAALGTCISDTPWYYAAEDFVQQVEFLDKIRPFSTAYWFCGFKKLKEIKNIENLDTTNVTNMAGMFGECENLIALDVSNFDTSNVTDMTWMFTSCKKLTTLDLSNFDTANVRAMTWMFRGCWNLTTIYTSDKFITPLYNSTDIFSGCTILVGGNGTTYNREHTGIEYAHIDGGADNPGYFTAKP